MNKKNNQVLNVEDKKDKDNKVIFNEKILEVGCEDKSDFYKNYDEDMKEKNLSNTEGTNKSKSSSPPKDENLEDIIHNEANDGNNFNKINIAQLNEEKQANEEPKDQQMNIDERVDSQTLQILLQKHPELKDEYEEIKKSMKEKIEKDLGIKKMDAKQVPNGNEGAK